MFIVCNITIKGIKKLIITLPEIPLSSIAAKTTKKFWVSLLILHYLVWLINCVVHIATARCLHLLITMNNSKILTKNWHPEGFHLPIGTLVSVVASTWQKIVLVIWTSYALHTWTLTFVRFLSWIQYKVLTLSQWNVLHQ